MRDDAQMVPVTCNPQALSAEAWAEHQVTTRRLFGELREASVELPDGYAFRFPASTFPRVATFVEGERRCCPFFTFRIEVPPADAAIILSITGSQETKAIIAAELFDQPYE